jgi:hypothetical protein
VSTVSLARPYASTYGQPVLTHVDTRIFELRYFQDCLRCSFCHDACCAHGVDVDEANVARIMTHADRLESFTGTRRTEWFAETWEADTEFPGGRATRTRVKDGACIFLNRTGRGCQIHAYALGNSLDVHELKPMVSALYPVTFDRGLLRPSIGVAEGGLVCEGQGASLYAGARGELAYYFGSQLVGELDAIEAESAPP